jgi:uncharacterized protein YbjQ (UPF0145 family)
VEEQGQRVCLRYGCELRNTATIEEKCSSCGFPTRPTSSEDLRARQETAELIEAELSAVAVPILIVTTNDVPGHDIVQVFGDVFGLTVRARDAFTNFGAKLQTIVGGEVVGYTKLLVLSRNEARSRLAAEAARMGANAVVAMRFDCSEMGGVMSEIAAYGTAVRIVPREAPRGSHTNQ